MFSSEYTANVAEVVDFCATKCKVLPVSMYGVEHAIDYSRCRLFQRPAPTNGAIILPKGTTNVFFRATGEK